MSGAPPIHFELDSIITKVATQNTKAENIPQASFHAHHGMDDWVVKLIDQAYDEPMLRKKESFWQYKLKTFMPNGLNERDVPVNFG